jgi:hypothetical protein
MGSRRKVAGMALDTAELEEIAALLDRLDDIQTSAITTDAELARRQAELIAIKGRACQIADKLGYQA